MVRMDQEPRPLSRSGRLLSKKRASALVIEADTVTLPPFALDQALLPCRVGLPRIVPEPGEEGEVTTTKGCGKIAGETSDVAQVIDEKLPLTSIVRGVRVEQMGTLVVRAT